MKLPRPQLSYSSVVATIALFLALGGTVYAAVHLPKNSVGSKQLRKNSVVSSKVKNGSLKASDFKGGSLPRGPQGPVGAPGARGPAGPGALKLFFDRAADSQEVDLGSVGPWDFRAMCELSSGSVPVALRVSAVGPGTAELSITEQEDEKPIFTALTVHDLTKEPRFISGGAKSPAKVRAVGTMVLSAGPANPVVTVSFSSFFDEGARRCTFAGTATPAS